MKIEQRTAIEERQRELGRERIRAKKSKGKRREETGERAFVAESISVIFKRIHVVALAEIMMV